MKRTNYLIIFLFTLFSVLLVFDAFAQDQHDKSLYYKQLTYEYAGITLPYRELDLNQDKEGTSILVIQLHGGTARGNDNKAQLDASAVDSIEIYLRVHGMKAIFLLPQCDQNRTWNESSRTQSTPMTEVLTHWLSDFISTSDVDKQRIYITGYSMGGSGAWRMLNDNTNLFAAACIAAATPLMVQAEKVMHTPVYAIAGSDDTIMDAEKIDAFVSSLLLMGDEVRFDLLEGKDHFGTCDAAFSRERLSWMFRHSRELPSSVTPKHKISTNDEIIYDINGRITKNNQHGIFIIRNSEGKTIKKLRK